MRLNDIPIQRKLMTVILMTSGAVLLLTCAAYFVYEFVTFRQTTVRQLTTLGQIVAANSTAALAFDDQEAAGEILSALRAEPHFVAAALYDEYGTLFAHYPADVLPADLPAGPAWRGYRFADGHLDGFQPVVLADRQLGTLYLRTGMGAMYARLRLYAVIAALVVGVSFLLAYLLSKALQRQISGPILALAETARAVSDRRDYGVRATRVGDDEVGLLTDAFNHMLTQIHEQVARLDLLNRITHAIGERQHLQSIFQVVVDRLEAHLPIDFGCVCLYDAERDVLTVSATGAADPALARALGLAPPARLATEQDGLARCLRGRLVYEPDMGRVDAPFPQRLAQAGLGALVLAPLAVEDSVFGVLVAARRKADSFSSPDCEFLRQLSEHVALAAHQAQLHEALQQAFDDLRRTQQTVMQQERLRALGQMASGIAHDINNAISPVTLYTESLLENEPGLSERARGYLETIQHGIDDVAATVARMREFYRRRDDRLDLAPVNLNTLVHHALDLTRARWSDMPQQRGVVVETQTELAPDVPEVLGVEGEIREALINLIFNAVDALPDGGTLTLRTRTGASVSTPGDAVPQRYVEVDVVDTGVGMDEDTRRRSMEPFFTTKGDRGTGLGLATVYGVVQRHGAEMDIWSAPGRGTTVRLRFPVPADLPAGPAAGDAGRGATRRLRILVVDDDPLILRSLRDTLETDGHVVLTANNGREGLDAFDAARRQGEPVSVVITDLGMPHMDGRQVAAAVRAAAPATPVLLLTGWGQRLLADGEELPDVFRVLTKPPKLRELRDALDACCRASA